VLQWKLRISDKFAFSQPITVHGKLFFSAI